MTIEQWYGSKPCTVELVSHSAVWYHTGLPVVSVRWVLMCDPKGKFEPQTFLCTNLNAAPEQLLTWFRQRWQPIGSLCY